MSLPLHDATAAVLSQVALQPISIEPVTRAMGYVVSQDIVSSVDLPPFANAAMDGFAVRSRDTVHPSGDPIALAITLESRAGQPSPGALDPGCASRISTGAALPEGADSVIRYDDATVVDEVLYLSESVQAHTHVRAAGDDVRRGSVVVQAGTRLRAGEVAMLAAIGLSDVPVRRTPRVAILTTGDEIVQPGQPLDPGQIHESNSVMLAALTREAGAQTSHVLSGIGDDLDSTIHAIDDAVASSDIIVISGGVSVGEHDYVRPALESLGAECVFWKVALRPGHPVWFGTLERDGERRLVFALPGNPVSAYVTFELFVTPAILKACGDREPFVEIPATYSGPTLHKQSGSAMAVRCRVDAGQFGILALLTTTDQRSHIVGSLVGADGIALVPTGRTRLEDGDRIMVRVRRPFATAASG